MLQYLCYAIKIVNITQPFNYENVLSLFLLLGGGVINPTLTHWAAAARWRNPISLLFRKQANPRSSSLGFAFSASLPSYRNRLRLMATLRSVMLASAVASAALAVEHAYADGAPFNFSPFNSYTSREAPPAQTSAAPGPPAADVPPAEVARVRNDNPRTTAAGFDPEALERGAKALRKINSSPQAKKVACRDQVRRFFLVSLNIRIIRGFPFFSFPLFLWWIRCLS